MDAVTTAVADGALPWGAVWGQDAAVATLRSAAADPAAMTHAWLITGPPGSGRSTLAHAFAAALIAGPEGTEAIVAVVEGALMWLAPGGLLVVEIGETQGPAVTDVAVAAGYVEVEVRPDLLGRDRALVARAPG